jgi:hypothetical protein
MSWQMNFWGFPRLHNYEQALKHYESITPIRGSNNLRPIANRRKQHCRIEQQSDGIHCILYNTSCIIYHPDDTMTIDFGGWYTSSTADFIGAISGKWALSKGYVLTNGGYYKVPNEGLKILADGTPENPVQEYRTLLDKKKAAETRKKLKPFLNWVDACLKLGGNFGHKDVYPLGALRAVIERNCQDSYPIVAGTYFAYSGSQGRINMLPAAYAITESFIKVPVPLGTERRPTQWD